jgi:hypothetical protein
VETVISSREAELNEGEANLLSKDEAKVNEVGRYFLMKRPSRLFVNLKTLSEMHFCLVSLML